MSTLRIIIAFFSLWTVACNNNSRHTDAKQQVSKFILDSSELRLLSDGLCGKRISLDSLTSITQYDSIRRSYFSVENNFKKLVCLGFNFYGETNFKSQRIFFQSIPTSYGIVATTIPSHSILHILISSSNSVSEIVGNEFYDGGEMPSDSLNNFVRRLFLNEPDSSRYGEKRLIIHLPNDSLHFADKYLTQIVIGYIDAQRELCKKRFGKDLKNASLKEIIELRTVTPLRLKFVAQKNHS